MYELKTLLPQFEINLPKCMYEMKNASLSADAVTNSNVEPSGANKSLNVSFISSFFFWAHMEVLFFYLTYVVIIYC